MKINMLSDNFQEFESEFYKYYAGDSPLYVLINDFAKSMTARKSNYFRLHKRYSTDGRDHYFYFDVVNGVYEYSHIKSE